MVQHVLQALVCLDVVASLSHCFLGVLALLAREEGDSVGLAVLEVPSFRTPLPSSRKGSWELMFRHMVACSEAMARMKVDNYSRKVSSDEQVLLLQHQGMLMVAELEG